jgi:hypothetical protein
VAGKQKKKECCCRRKRGDGGKAREERPARTLPDLVRAQNSRAKACSSLKHMWIWRLALERQVRLTFPLGIDRDQVGASKADINQSFGGVRKIDREKASCGGGGSSSSRSDTTEVLYRLTIRPCEWCCSPLPPTPPRAAGRTRSGSAKDKCE